MTSPEKKPSLLERAARAIEPPPKPKSHAFRIKGLHEIVGGGKSRHVGPAQPTKHIFRTSEGGRIMQYFDDGSLRHARPRVRGKAAVKAAKRARQAARA